jgi:hypothetical protein
MHPAISYELATARIADLRRQAQRDALTCAATPVPSSAPQPGRNRTPVGLRGAGRPRHFGQQLWTLPTHRSCSTARPPLQAGAMYIVT